MKLIADGGSTKTDWRLVKDEQNIVAAQSGGINPYHLSPSEIDLVLADLHFPFEDMEITQLYFYGAGIAGDKPKQILQAALKKRFGAHIEVFVGDDMLGAARALLKNQNGIACILGTGSNSCLFEHGQITSKIPPLGYILGDEGSGTDIGKRFINALFKGDFPQPLCEQILKEEQLNMLDVIEKVYRNELPAKYLASMTQIVKKYINHEVVAKIVYEAFESFIQKNISKYKDYSKYEVGFVGSLALHFQEILVQVLESRDAKLGLILPAPIDELASYHMAQ